MIHQCTLLTSPLVFEMHSCQSAACAEKISLSKVSKLVKVTIRITKTLTEFVLNNVEWLAFDDRICQALRDMFFVAYVTLR